MKTMKLISGIILSVFMLLLSPGVSAQDPVKAASKIFKKVAVDNDEVRVMHVEYAPGDVADWHYISNHVVYVVSGGKVEVTAKGKKANAMELKTNDVKYMKAETHMVKNVGKTTIKLVVTELKHVH